MTARLAFADPSPSRVAGPILTSATSPRVMGVPSRTASTVCEISSRCWIRPVARMRYSCPRSMNTPPDAFTFDPSAARSASSSVRSKAANRAGSTRTWYCLTSPPSGTTCATPGTARRRRRIVQSATERMSMGETDASPVTAISMISPMMDEIGAKVGVPTPPGRADATS